MFDVGFIEILLLGVIALLVLGPERLPKAARIFGGFMRKARRSFEGIKQEIEREIDADELKRSIAAMPTIASIEEHIKAPFQDISNAIENERQNMNQSFDDLRSEVAKLEEPQPDVSSGKPLLSKTAPAEPKAALEKTAPELALDLPADANKPAAT